MTLRRRILNTSTLALAIGMVVFTIPTGAATPSVWNAYYYNNGGVGGPTPAGLGSLVSLNFAPGYVASLTTTSPAVTGNLTGLTVTADISVTRVSSTAHFVYQDAWCGSTPASVRFFFTSTAMSGTSWPQPGVPPAPWTPGTSPAFGLTPSAYYSHSWWSNPTALTLDSLNGTTLTLTATFSVDSWSDWNGQEASLVPDSFAAAVAHVKSIGFSFGGGCFFENGATTSDGSGTFNVMAFSVG